MPQRPEVLTKDWELLDAKLAQLGVPVYRVPGNHDVHDPISRDIYFARYEKLPRAFSHGGTRFLLLNSTYVPEGTETPPWIRGQPPYLRGKQLDAEQIEFIRKELAGNHDNIFLFMHHILWWHEEEAVWWREVHPLLVGSKVRAVFAGDAGPRKFSHVRRDGIDYIQSAIANTQMENLRRNWRQRMVVQQFDNFLHVTVDGPAAAIAVEIVGALTLGQFTPETWREMHRPYPPEEKSFFQRVWAFIETPRRLAIFASVMIACFLGGIAATLVWRRRRKTV
jgi:3',5'-cyclic AMP phosphodiesterase CpdA